MTATSIAFLLLLSMDALAAEPRLPLPDKSARDAATTELVNTFGGDRKNAKDAKAHQALSRKFAELALEEKRPAVRYILLRAAIEEAGRANDAPGVLKAADLIEANFELTPEDNISLRLEAVAQAKKGLRAEDAAQSRAVLLAMIHALDTIISADDPVSALTAGEIADQLSAQFKTTRNKELATLNQRLKTWRGYLLDFKAHYPEGVTASESRRLELLDPETNASVGRYLCYQLGNWNRGLPLLAKGTNPVAKVAARDLSGARTTEAQLALGDAWWAESEAEKPATLAWANLQGRAAFWYQMVLPQLKGINNEKVKQRLALSAETRRGSDREIVVSPPAAVEAKANPKANATLKAGDYICRFQRDNPFTVDEKTRLCKVYYQMNELKLENERGDVADAQVKQIQGVWKVTALRGPGWIPGTTGTIEKEGTVINWSVKNGPDNGVWILKK